MSLTPSLRHRVKRLESAARAARPLLVFVRCLSGEAVRITGPEGAVWHRARDETAEAFADRAVSDARIAMHRSADPPPAWVLSESRSPVERPWSKTERTTA